MSGCSRVLTSVLWSGPSEVFGHDAPVILGGCRLPISVERSPGGSSSVVTCTRSKEDDKWETRVIDGSLSVLTETVE